MKKEPWPLATPRSLSLLALVGTLCFITVYSVMQPEGDVFDKILPVLAGAIGTILGWFFRMATEKDGGE